MSTLTDKTLIHRYALASSTLLILLAENTDVDGFFYRVQLPFLPWWAAVVPNTLRFLEPWLPKHEEPFGGDLRRNLAYSGGEHIPASGAIPHGG